MLPSSISFLLLLVHAVNAVPTTITTVNPAGQQIILITDNGVAAPGAPTTTTGTTTTQNQPAGPAAPAAPAAPTTTTGTTTTQLQPAGPAAPAAPAAPTTTTGTTTTQNQPAGPAAPAAPAAPTTTTGTTTTQLQQGAGPGAGAPIQNGNNDASVSPLSVDLSYASLLPDRPNPSTAVRPSPDGTYASDPYATIEEKSTTYITERKSTDAWITSTISGGTSTTHIQTNYQQLFSVHNTIAESVQAGSVGLGTISGSVGDYRPPFTITTTNGVAGFTYAGGVGSVMSVLLMFVGFVL